MNAFINFFTKVGKERENKNSIVTVQVGPKREDLLSVTKNYPTILTTECQIHYYLSSQPLYFEDPMYQPTST